MIAFPMCVLPPHAFRWAPSIAVAGGGRPISGPAQTGNLSGGFHWICEQQDHRLRRRPTFNAWYGLLINLLSVSPIIDVRWLSQPMAPWPVGQTHGGSSVPHSDGAYFSDGAGYLGRSIDFALVDAIALNDTEALIRCDAGRAPIGGEPFSLRGASGYAHLHIVGSVVAEGGDTYRIRFGPDAREDYPAETPLDFERPCCTMRPDLATIDQAFPSIRLPYAATAGIRFEEDWP